jgi:hypothetical protein
VTHPPRVEAHQGDRPTRPRRPADGGIRRLTLTLLREKPERALRGLAHLRGQISGGRLTDEAIRRARPADDHLVAIEKGSDGVRREMLLEENARQRIEVEARAQDVFGRTISNNRHRDQHDERSISEAALEHVGHDRALGSRDLRDHLRVAGDRQEGPEGKPRVEKLPALRGEQDHTVPGRLAGENGMRGPVELFEISVLKMRGGGQGLEDGHRSADVLVDRHGQGAGGLDQTPLRGRSSLPIERHQHESGKGEDRDESGENQQHQPRSDLGRSEPWPDGAGQADHDPIIGDQKKGTVIRAADGRDCRRRS